MQSPKVTIYFLLRCINIKFYGNYNGPKLGLCITPRYHLFVLKFSVHVLTIFSCHYPHQLYVYVYTSLYQRCMDFAVAEMLLRDDTISVLLGTYHCSVHIIYVIIWLWFFRLMSSIIFQIIELFGLQKPQPVQIAINDKPKASSNPFIVLFGSLKDCISFKFKNTVFKRLSRI